MEYVLLISIIVAAVVIMLPRVKRTTQSMIKTGVDQIGDQQGAEQTFNDVTIGYLESSNSTMRTMVNNLRTDMAGNINQAFNESTDTTTTSVLNMGFTPE